MATHSSILAWRISWTEKSGRLSPWSQEESDTTEGLTHIVKHHIENNDMTMPGNNLLPLNSKSHLVPAVIMG